MHEQIPRPDAAMRTRRMRIHAHTPFRLHTDTFSGSSASEAGGGSGTWRIMTWSTAHTCVCLLLTRVCVCACVFVCVSQENVISNVMRGAGPLHLSGMGAEGAVNHVRVCVSVELSYAQPSRGVYRLCASRCRTIRVNGFCVCLCVCVQVRVWRPLLRHSKDDIFDLAHTYGVPYFKVCVCVCVHIHVRITEKKKRAKSHVPHLL